ncbi:MAG: hypothetical protein ACI9GZ_003052 [Bacteroidia bacterium]|jgi:hypothetical protein
MEKLNKVIESLEQLKANQRGIIEKGEVAERSLNRLGDQTLIQTIREIRTKSELSFLDIENALEYYHLKISDIEKGNE